MKQYQKNVKMTNCLKNTQSDPREFYLKALDITLR